MTTRIYYAPAATGKTLFILEKAQRASFKLQAESLIIVPNSSNKYDLQRRLAERGGALGVRIETFRQFSKDILAITGHEYATISDAQRLRLLQHVVNHFPLEHYRPLVNKPGFIWKLVEFIHTLKDAKIFPKEFLDAVDRYNETQRLSELGNIYEEYQSKLQEFEWADRSGWAWLAVEALEKDIDKVSEKWPLVIVDGFDNFSEVLLAMLERLHGDIEELVITLTRESDEQQGVRQPFKLFQRTMKKLEE